MKNKPTKVFFNGIVTGLVLQLAIGPVFFYIINLTLQNGLLSGLAAALAVCLADYIYIALTIFGLSKLLDNKKNKKLLSLVGPLVLIIFALAMLENSWSAKTLVAETSASIWLSFISTFLLTIASPMTIFFWTSLFVTKADEYHYSKKELRYFGLGAGLATLIFMSLAVSIISILKTSIPVGVMFYLNILVAIILLVYGVGRLYKSFTDK